MSAEGMILTVFTGRPLSAVSYLLPSCLCNNYRLDVQLSKFKLKLLQEFRIQVYSPPFG